MFYITYYAKKHGKFITRKGQYDKPDGTKGKSFVSKNGVPCLVYWDLDNDGWRMAVGETRVRIRLKLLQDFSNGLNRFCWLQCLA